MSSSFVLDPSYNTQHLSGNIYANQIFAYPGSGGFSTTQTFETIQRLPETQINIFDTTGSVQVVLPVGIFNAKLGLFKTARSALGGFLYDATDSCGNYYDNANNVLTTDTITLTANEFTLNLPSAASIISVGKLSTIYTDFANYVAAYFNLANPSSNSTGFATLFQHDYHFNPNEGVFDASALYQVIKGNGVIDATNHSGITTLGGSVTVSNITKLLRYAVDTNAFGNRDPSNGMTAIDPSNAANYGVSDGFLAGDVIFVPNNGFALQLNANINYGATMNNYIQNNPNQQPVISYVDTSLNNLAGFHTTSTNTTSYIGRQMSTPLLIRLVDTAVAVAQSMPTQDITAGSSTINLVSYTGLTLGMTIVVGSGATAETRTIVGFGSVVLDRPLVNSHPAATTVVTAYHPIQLLDASGVLADVSGQNVTLHFQGSYTGVNIYRGTTQVNSSLVTSNSYVDTNVPGGATYSYSIVPVNAQGMSGKAIQVTANVPLPNSQTYTNVNILPMTQLTTLGTNVITGQTGVNAWKNGTWVTSTSDPITFAGNIINFFNGTKMGDTGEFVSNTIFNGANVNGSLRYSGTGTTMVNGTSVSAMWIQLQLPSNVVFHMTSYYLKGIWNNYVASWILCGSNDGINFTTIDDQSTVKTQGNSPSSGGTNITRNTTTNTNYYTYIRFLALYGGGFYEIYDAIYTGDIQSSTSTTTTSFDMINPGVIRTIYPTNPNNSPYYFAWDNNVSHTSYVNSLAFFNNYTLSDTITSILPTISIANTSGGQFAVSNKGYFKPDATGTWTFTFRADDIGVLWIGTTPNQSYSSFYASLTETNYHLAGWFSSGFVSYSVTLSSSMYYPFLLNWAESWGGYRLEFSVTSPSNVNTDGSNYFYHISTPDIQFNCSTESIESVSPYRIKNVVTNTYSSNITLSAAPSSSIVNMNPGGTSGGQATIVPYHINYGPVWKTPVQATGAGYTFTSWFYMTQTTGCFRWITSNDNYTYHTQYVIATPTSGYFQMNLRGSQINEWNGMWLNNYALNDNKWHFFSATIKCTNGSTGAFTLTYMLDPGSGLPTEISQTFPHNNGYPSNFSTPSGGFNFGGNDDSTGNGYSTNFRVYSEPLSSSQLAYMYTNKL
jgi:GLEYA domain